MERADLSRLIQQLDLDISKETLERAFFHSSYVNEISDDLESNERLEFLGDAVIELAVSQHLFVTYPMSEGELTKIKSVVVSGPVLARKSSDLELSSYIYLGKGEEEAGGRLRRSILSDLFEAFVGILFLNSGFEVAAKFVLSQLQSEIEESVGGKNYRDYKTMLQEIAQSQGVRPIYSLIDSRGADHQKEFTVRVELKGESSEGTGGRVKDAEQAAAKELYQIIESE
jgi:ribonuclease-3